MRLSIQFNPNKRIDLDFGYKTPLFEGMHWFSIITCHLDDNGVVEFAILHYTWFLHPKYWFNSWGRKPKKQPYIMDVTGDPDDLHQDCPDCGADLNSGIPHYFGCSYRENNT